MGNGCWIRVTSSTIVIALTAAFLSLGEAHAQIWLCGKCKCRVGSGPNPPSKCPHCKARLRGGFGFTSFGGTKPSNTGSTSTEKSTEFPIGILAVLGIGVAVIGFVTLKNASRSPLS